MRARSELVPETGADGIDAGVDRGCKADIFPLCPQKQAGTQHHIDAKTGGVTINQVAVDAVRAAQIEWDILEAGSCGRVDRNPVDVGRLGDVGLPERNAPEQIRREKSTA